MEKSRQKPQERMSTLTNVGLVPKVQRSLDRLIKSYTDYILKYFLSIFAGSEDQQV